MADPPPDHGRRLDASGSREVVFCHQCENEWYRDEMGLVCPRCQGEATEIISAENDPRAPVTQNRPDDDVQDGLRDLHNHHPWHGENVPDPDDGDIEEYVRVPGGSTFYTRTFRSGGPRSPVRNPNDPANVIGDFHSMIGSFMPGFQQGQAGRSGPDNLYPPRPEGFQRQGGFMFGSGNGPHIVGGRYTYTRSTRPGQQPSDDFATYAPAPSSPPSGPAFLVLEIRARPDQLARILGSIFGPNSPIGAMNHGREGEMHPGLPPGLQGLLAALFNPQNAVAGDAVYSQEALDRIISTLMDQHPTSNAPGPASAEAIASLPKRNLDEKMLGPELKAECSVCMDDVHLGDEVVVLPCKHWFHETCASAWLSEHNTCPICRTGIGSDGNSPPSDPSPAAPRRSSRTPNPVPPVNEATRAAARQTMVRRSSRNEARLESIRDRGRIDSAHDGSSRRHPIVVDGSRHGTNRSPSPPVMPGGYGTTSGSQFRRRDSEFSDSQREARRSTGGSDGSRRSSGSGSSQQGGGGGGPMAWIRRMTSGNGSNGNSPRRE